MADYPLLRDRVIRPKPALPVIGAAGSLFIDPSFQTPLRRVTDNNTDAGRSFKTPSSEQCFAWSKDSALFYTTQSGGTIRLWTFDGTGRATPRETVGFINEPTFSQATPNLMYGARGHRIDQYDTLAKTYSTIVDVDQVDPGKIPAGAYLGGTVQSSGGPVERVCCFYGGTSQDRHFRVLVADKNYASERWIMDTMAETIDGTHIAGAFGGGIMIHGLGIDRSGRYVLIYTSQQRSDIIGFVQNPPNGKYQVYVWDVEAGVVSPLTWDISPYGHDAMGYGVRVNRDGYGTNPWEASQWVYRSLADVRTLSTIISPQLSPSITYEADHPNWNNASPDTLNPFITAQYRYRDAPDLTGAVLNTCPWRAWDDEVLLIEPVPGRDPWRVCHHRSNIAPDNQVGDIGFWYTPRPQISPDGQWALFTSNMEKTLGDDTYSTDATTKKRTDVFLVRLARINRPQSISDWYASAKSALSSLSAQTGASAAELSLLKTASDATAAADAESLKTAAGQ